MVKRTGSLLGCGMVAKVQPLAVALSIAGSDSGAGAGIQADLLSFARCGVYGTTAITCLTAQNPVGVSDLHPVPGRHVAAQCRQVLGYFDVRAAKTGMLLNREIIETVAGILADQPQLPVVVDPVMVATSGAVLLEPEAIEALKAEMLPRAALLTPNLDEAGVLIGKKPDTVETMKTAARTLFDTYGAPVLLKGGHLEGDSLTDLLVTAPDTLDYFHAERQTSVQTHGSGCTLSAAIAAHLARGLAIPEAIAAGHAYLQAGLKQPLRLGDESFIDHDGEERRGDGTTP
ncbi:MAG: bifunctional hydroxymethylpyrimidine kinase/phosphomethylpyrimidine kinase [Opitutales bacterium]